jgi:hypothetical protein
MQAWRNLLTEYSTGRANAEHQALQRWFAQPIGVLSGAKVK